MIDSLHCKWSNCSKTQHILNIHLLCHYYLEKNEKMPFFVFFGRSGGFLDQNSSKLMDSLIFRYYWAHTISHCSIHFYDLLSYPSITDSAVSVSERTKVYASYMITTQSENQCMTRKLISAETVIRAHVLAGCFMQVKKFDFPFEAIENSFSRTNILNPKLRKDSRERSAVVCDLVTRENTTADLAEEWEWDSWRRLTRVKIDW